jgi:dCTP deaminase
MLLQDTAIRAMLDSGHVKITPLDRACIQPASVDVHLGDQFRTIDEHACAYVSLRHAEAPTILHEMGGRPFNLAPGRFALATTAETICLPDDVAARIEGKSSVGRLGLLVHSTAGWIDPGFEGQVTLELVNAGPVPVGLCAGEPIGQVCLFRLEGPAARPYGHPGLGSRYQHQRGPTPARSQPGRGNGSVS